MSSVVKENTILTSIPESGAASSTNSAAHHSSDSSARPQPVALEVSVTVNGARTVAGSDKREPFSESTKTVLIFVNGAVVRLSSAVFPGQLLFLTNEQTKKEVVCQVVKSKNYQNITGYVELEFTEPVAGFWGMRFPAGTSAQSTPSAPAPSPKASTTNFASASKPQNAGASLSSERKTPAPSLPRVSLPVPSGPSVSANQPSPYSSTASTSHSQIPAPASRPQISVTPVFPASSKPSNVVEISRPSVSSSAPTSEAPAAAKHSTPAKSILDTDEVKIPSWLEPLARNAATSAADSTPADHLQDEYPLEVEDPPVAEAEDTPEPARLADPAPVFRAHFLAEEHSEEPATSSGSSKKVLIGAVAAGLLLLAGGGAWYLRQRPATSGPSTSAAAVVVPTTENASGTPAESVSPAAAQSAPSGTYQSVSTPASANGLPAGAVAAKSVEGANANQNKRLATVDAAPAAVPQPKKPMLGTVNLANPIVNKAAGSENSPAEALNLEASSAAQPADSLSSGLVANSRQPAAPPIPLPVGGKVKTAKLLSSVAPSYPSIARSQRLAGDVKIDALIDATGRVSKMAIISGPPLLRDSAMEALHQWKYEPAQLDGKPVPMHLTVTIQFKLQ